MYNEERNEKNYFFRNLIVKILLVLLFIFLLMWLFPIPNLSPFYDKIFTQNINDMTDAAKSYFTVERLPKNENETKKLTLKSVFNIISPQNGFCLKNLTPSSENFQSYIKSVNPEGFIEYVPSLSGLWNIWEFAIKLQKYSAIQLNIILVITSCIPNLAFKNPTIPPSKAPANTPEKTTSGICIIGWKSKTIPTIVEITVEKIYCPSEPILKSPDLNANATLIPVKIIGVLLSIILTINFGLEKIALNITANDIAGL